jgi:hypothetical protein
MRSSHAGSLAASARTRSPTITTGHPSGIPTRHAAYRDIRHLHDLSPSLAACCRAALFVLFGEIALFPGPVDDAASAWEIIESIAFETSGIPRFCFPKSLTAAPRQRALRSAMIAFRFFTGLSKSCAAPAKSYARSTLLPHRPKGFEINIFKHRVMKNRRAGHDRPAGMESPAYCGYRVNVPACNRSFGADELPTSTV